MSLLNAIAIATQPPVIAAVRVPPSACKTSQSIQMVRWPTFFKSTTARSERPMRRWISDERPSILPREMSRGLRSSVEYGSIEYSAVSHPPSTFCARIQRGTSSSIVAVQMTRVSPNETSTEPVACGATFGMNEIGRS